MTSSDDIRQFAKPHKLRPQWRSRVGFILAALGSAIGLGNIWRFSYLCYKNGGGAFLIPYTIALLIVGIPLMILELGIGHMMRGSAPMTLARVDRHWEWLGWWCVFSAMYGIMLYYSAVIGWCLSYVFFSITQAWGDDPNAFFFQQFLQISDGPFHIGDLRSPILFAVLFVWLASWVIVFFGVQKGLERANKIFMPLLFIQILILVVWSLSLDGAWRGVAVYLKPDFGRLADKQIWIDAFSQIFFTLSLGFGIMITYASYLPRKADVVEDAVVVSLGNCFFSIIAGFAVFGTLGYMATATGKPISEIASEAIALSFVTYPQTISLFPEGLNAVFGVLFFSTLVIAGLSSAVSLVEAFTAAMIDKFHYRREIVVSVVCLTGFLGSMIFTTQGGLYWLDIVDHFITQYGLVLAGILECVAVAWVFRARRLRQHINHVGRWPLPRIWEWCVLFVIPLVLGVLFLNSLWTDWHTPYGGYSWIAIILIGRDWLLAALFAALIVSMRPWKKDLAQDVATD